MNSEYAIKYTTPWHDFIGTLDNTKVFHGQQSVIRIMAGAKRSVFMENLGFLIIFHFSANRSHVPENKRIIVWLLERARHFSLLQSVQTSCRAYPAQAKSSKGQYLWKKGNKEVGNINKNLFEGLLHKATDRCLTHNLMNGSQQTSGKWDHGNRQLKTRPSLAFRKNDYCKNLQSPSIFCLY